MLYFLYVFVTVADSRVLTCSSEPMDVSNAAQKANDTTCWIVDDQFYDSVNFPVPRGMLTNMLHL